MTSAKNLARIPEYEGARHPAYEHLFYAYVLSGRSTTEAVKLVRKWWPTEQKGLPTRQAVDKWVAIDRWDEFIDTDAQVNQRAYRALTNARLISAGPMMAQRLISIAQGDFPDARSGSVMANAAKTVLYMIAAGVLENRAGDIPDDDTERKRQLSEIEQAPLAEIVAQHAAAWEATLPDDEDGDDEYDDDEYDDEDGEGGGPAPERHYHPGGDDYDEHEQ